MECKKPCQTNFMRGYPYENRYHNIGRVTSPYIGKKGGGDWSPNQWSYSARTGQYYNVINPTYVYPLDNYKPNGNYTCCGSKY